MGKFNSYSVTNKLSSQQVAPRTVPVYAPGRIEARERVQARAVSRQAAIPHWAIFLALVVLTFGACLTLNIKSQIEFQSVEQRNSALQAEIKQFQNGNTAIAEEINRLQTDKATIERHARERLNMLRPDEKVLVPAR